MRSIRLWLVVYLVALLGVVMGGVGMYVYRENEHVLLDKEDGIARQLRANHQKTIQETHHQFDAELLKRAHSLAEVAIANWRSTRGLNGIHLYSLGLLSNILAPPSHAVVPLWIGQETNTTLAWHVYRPNMQMYIELPFGVAEEIDMDSSKFFQMYSESGRVLSKSYDLHEEVFALPEAVRKDQRLYEPFFDHVDLPDGRTVRRVTLRTPVRNQRIFQTPPVRLPGKPPPMWGARYPDRSPLVGRESWPRPVGTVITQFASTVDDREARTAALGENFNRELELLRAQTMTALKSTRTRLLLVIAAVLVFTVLGTVFIVKFGLHPVKRIAQGVSEVSEKDFRLNLEEKDVPIEMAPIVAKLRHTLDSLGKAFAREKQAVADISHDLRTPIAALLTTAQVCLRKERTSEEYRKALATCSGIGEQLRTLVERLLLLARLDAGVDQLRPQEVNVPDLAAQCVSIVRPLAEAQNLELKFERNGPISIRTDPDKLREVLTNLLDNAVQYNRPGGRIELTLARENGHVCMEVKDTGLGISPEAQAHLFERFYRADPSRQSDTVHCGLGLAIVKGYVDLMGGKIEVDSVVNQGSTFRILLPVPAEAVEETDKK